MIARAIIFTLLIPGTIAGLFPYLLATAFPETLSLSVLRLLGALFMCLGLILYVLCVARFLTEGRGTPTMWFTKPLRHLIGEEPQELVTTSLYRFSRNPMYLGVLTFVLGQAIWFERQVLFIYVVLLWLFFHLVIVFIEEPHLKRKMGEQYESYSRSVPRWIGRGTVDQ